MDRQKADKRKMIRRGFLLAMVFMLLWVLASVVNAFFPKRAMSTRERRALRGFPEITLARLLDGRFEADFEEFAKDQIAGRDALVALDAAVSRGTGNVLSSGVWIGKDGWLIEDPEIWDGREVPSALDGVNRLAKDWGFDVTLAVVPEAAEILPDKLPWAANGEKLSERSQESWDALIAAHLGAGVKVAEVTEALREAAAKQAAGKAGADEKQAEKNAGADAAEDVKKAAELYYHTDHHWTTYGAQNALTAILEPLRETAGAYELLKVSGSFQGTLASMAGVHSVWDEIYVAAPKGRADVPVIVRIEGAEGIRTSVYSMEGLQSDDPYTVFMGGNYGKFTVTTGQAGKGKLFVLKDSYFNCLLPMLLENFNEITVVDPRYYDGDPEMLLLSMKGAKVLVCYSRATFLTDQSLGRLVPEKSK